MPAGPPNLAGSQTDGFPNLEFRKTGRGHAVVPLCVGRRAGVVAATAVPGRSPGGLGFDQHLALPNLLSSPLSGGGMTLRAEYFQSHEPAKALAGRLANPVIQDGEVLSEHDRGDLEFPQNSQLAHQLPTDRLLALIREKEGIMPARSAGGSPAETELHERIGKPPISRIEGRKPHYANFPVIEEIIHGEG